MKLDSLNKWLTLIANFGVLIGIVFLSLEFGQSNRIAEREGRSEQISQEIEIQRLFLENAEVAALMVKLSDSDAQLTPIEIFQVKSFATLLILRIANLNISYESDFLSGVALERQLNGVARNIQKVPGIAPYLAEAMQNSGLMPRGQNPVFDKIWGTIDNIE